jgi:hypothetical protein
MKGRKSESSRLKVEKEETDRRNHTESRGLGNEVNTE